MSQRRNPHDPRPFAKRFPEPTREGKRKKKMLVPAKKDAGKKMASRSHWKTPLTRIRIPATWASSKSILETGRPASYLFRRLQRVLLGKCPKILASEDQRSAQHGMRARRCSLYCSYTACFRKTSSRGKGTKQSPGKRNFIAALLVVVVVLTPVFIDGQPGSMQNPPRNIVVSPSLNHAIWISITGEIC